MTGSTPRSAAIAGNEVAITEASMFSMNSAEATTSGMSHMAVDWAAASGAVCSEGADMRAT